MQLGLGNALSPLACHFTASEQSLAMIMDEIVIRRLGYVDLFVASVSVGVCLFLVFFIYQRAKEHPLNYDLRKAQQIDECIHKQ